MEKHSSIPSLPPVKQTMTRRRFSLFAAATAFGSLGSLTGCSEASKDPSNGEAPTATNASEDASSLDPLPPAAPDPENPFGVDKNINMATIDAYLNRPDVVYREMRLAEDPADYASIGGSPNLDDVLPGFKVMPFPYVGTLAPLPVSGAYTGDTLFEVTWGDGIEVKNAAPRYAESMQILEEVFPRDKAIFLMCGGGGYAGMMRNLLIHLGWDADKVYNLGGGWDYTGDNLVELISYDNDGTPHFHLWRADIVPVDFSQYTPVESQ